MTKRPKQTKTIAWVDAEPSYSEAYRDVINIDIPHCRIDILPLTADSALERLLAQKYDLIVVDPYLAPGFEYTNLPWSYANNPYLIGEDLIKRVRATGVNTKTPLITLLKGAAEKSVYHNFNLRHRFQSAGAQETLFCLNYNVLDFPELIQKYLL